jgi:hypothetical protein
MDFLLFPLLWVVISFGVSLAGWQKLTTQYRATNLPLNTTVSSLSYAKMGWADYKNVIRAGASQEGLALQVFFLFRLFHPPLLIPWSAVGSIQSSTSFWSTTYYSITIATDDMTTIEFRFTSSALLAELRPWVRVVTSIS